jgi:hypothetical protein
MKTPWLLVLAACTPSYADDKVPARLATEKLAGNVLVREGVDLYPSLAAAKSGAKPKTQGDARAMAVIRDHGDVIEVSTAPSTDCADDFKPPYELTVFVKRENLMLRAKRDVTKSFADGTAIAIDRGSPIEVGASGFVWAVGAFNTSKVLPSDDLLTYAVPPMQTAVALPPVTGDRLVCDGGPMTLAEYREHRKREREAKYAQEAEQRRAEAEARRAQAEREREERERQRKEREAKAPKKNKKRSNEMEREDEAARWALRLTGDNADTGDRSDGPRNPGAYDLGSLGGYEDEAYAPYCGVADPSVYAIGTSTTKAPTVNGNVLGWPTYSATKNDQVVKSGSKYFGDVDYTCGRIRMTVEREGVHTIGGGAGVGGGGQIELWVPAKGPVTWPDGKPAGKYTGEKRYRDVVEKDNRICVRVSGVAELVCHPKKTATKTKGSRWDTD